MYHSRFTAISMRIILLLSIIFPLSITVVAFSDIYINRDNPCESGCLSREVKDWSKKRVCNSEDPEDAASSGLCIESDFEYPEIRIYAQNWDSAIYQSWILQILLSEILGVPTSIETGKPGQAANFYDSKNSIDYGTSNVYEGFVKAREVNDCRKLKQTKIGYQNSDSNYKPCTHVMVESWNSGNENPIINELLGNNTIAFPKFNGYLGHEGWYVPKFTASRFPAFRTYRGLQDETSRRKIAEAFLTPTTWKYYCDNISSTNCTSDDDDDNRIASRPPANENEENSFFSSDGYIGHFRMTEFNNCTKYPLNCTGYFVDFPCDWSSNSLPQVYHLKLPFRVKRHSHPEMMQIWNAANATKSHTIMMYWSPENLYSKYIGTDFAFTSVHLPDATQECIDNRVSLSDKCTEDFERSVGKAVGSCGETPAILHNVISTVLEDAWSSKCGSRSPAYDAIRAFQLSNIQVNDIIAEVDEHDSPREAVCQWVSKNLGEMKKFVPEEYPRTLQKQVDNVYLLSFTIILAATAIVGVLVTGFFVYSRRHERLIRIAQFDFLILLLVGCLWIVVGSLFMALPTSIIPCVFEEWFVNLGYTLEMIPLLVKVAAVNQLMNAASKYRRTRLTRRALFGKVFAILMLVVIYLLVWTIFDMPREREEFTLDDPATSSEHQADDAVGGKMLFEETTVKVSYYCESSNRIWSLVGGLWHTILLLCATVLAYQSRNIRQEFNETQTLTSLIYVNFLFVLIRLSTLLGIITGSRRDLILIRSIIHSIDTISSLIIYFMPKLTGRVIALSGRRGSGWLRKMDNFDRARHLSSSVIANSATVSSLGRRYPSSGLHGGRLPNLDDSNQREFASILVDLFEKIIGSASTIINKEQYEQLANLWKTAMDDTENVILIEKMKCMVVVREPNDDGSDTCPSDPL